MSVPAPGGRVLVVEDDPDIGRLILVLLGRAGLDGTLRTDGDSGLRAVAEVRPDLLVLDIGLPGMDGWQVLERLRADDTTRGAGTGGRLPVLLLSAHAQEDDRNRGLELGADDFVLKPFRNTDLLARLSRLLPAAGPDAGGSA